MNKQLLASAVALFVLTSCSSTTSVDSEVSKELQSKIENIKLNGALVKQGEGFVLSPTLFPESTDPKGMLEANSWAFNGKTLYPSFDSKRFECKFSKHECSQYEEIDSPFLTLSVTRSDYGDTYEERVADGKEPGMRASTLVFLGFTSIVAAPFLVIGTPIALINGTTNLIQNGSVWRTKWVEFDHDSFYEQTIAAIQIRHGSVENYIDYMASASSAFTELSRYSNQLNDELVFKHRFKSELIHRYQPLKLMEITAYSIQIPSYGDIQSKVIQIKSEIKSYYEDLEVAYLADYDTKLDKAKAHFKQEQISSYESAQNSEALWQFIEKYKNRDEAKLVDLAREKWASIVTEEQKIAFGKISSLGDAKKFVTNYQYRDEASLVEKVKNFISAEEHKIKKEQADKQKLLIAKLETWRKGLKVGDNTFCGRVIEAKYPMYQIAISIPLQGFSDTIWLQKDNIFEPWSGCINRNNHLTPQINPLN